MQEKYFEITVMHYDKLIGTVYIDLSNLLSSRHEALQHGLDAWFPIYHFEKGLRGDLQVKVKLTFIKDENTAKFISSTEIEYYCKVMPPNHKIKQVLKFVEELVEC